MSSDEAKIDIDELSKDFKSNAVVSEEGEDNFQDAQEGDEVNSAETDFEDSDIGTTMPSPPSFKSVLLQLLKTVATSGTDLFAMSSPAILCNGISVLEYCSHYCDHPEILAAIPKGETPLDRMLVVVQWYLSGLYGSYASRSTSSGFERKPFNPILGERFFAEWADEGYGKTEMIAEQVSHHPPTTAFYLHNATAGIHVNAFSTQKTRFLGTGIKAEQQGNVFVYLDKLDEEYMISFPEIYVRGLLTGAPFIELCGDVAMVSSSGFGVKMRFIPKPWFSGEYDQVEAVIFDTKSGKIHYDIWGKWSNSIYFDEHDEESEKRCHFRKRDHKVNNNNNNNNSSSSSSNNVPSSSETEGAISSSTTGEPYSSLVADHTRQGPTLFNPEMMPKIPFQVKPISKQTSLESRRVWHPVAKALKNADYEAANAAKNDIENEQRALRRERADSGEVWKPHFFKYEKFCFMPAVNKKSEHLEDILANLITESPKMLLTTVENDNDNNESSNSSTSSISRTKSKHSYKGRWIFKEFLENRKS
jgi:oxysterol-binding protein-related protein 9/10/11